MTLSAAKRERDLLVEAGLASDKDDAAHFLVDCGEIDSIQHAALLSPAERKRIYGD